MTAEAAYKAHLSTCPACQLDQGCPEEQDLYLALVQGAIVAWDNR